LFLVRCYYLSLFICCVLYLSFFNYPSPTNIYTLSLHDALPIYLQGKYVFMTFFYTSCSTVCPQLEMNVKEVYNQVPETYLEEDVVFLSVSFDPDRDTPEVLEKYRDYFETDEDEWLMARVK